MDLNKSKMKKRCKTQYTVHRCIYEPTPNIPEILQIEIPHYLKIK